jgi:hypothetical protein
MPVRFIEEVPLASAITRLPGAAGLGVLNGQPLMRTSAGLIPIGAVNPTGAQDYYVDLNVSASGDGLSPATAMATIAEAITASDASIGLSANRWWARRNRIFVMGDGITESLTVLPEKCDIIGMGADLFPFPRINGIHTITANKVGCRFINMGFVATTNGTIFTIPASSHGISFIGCEFWPQNGVSAAALDITTSVGVRIIGNKFHLSQADIAKLFTTAILIKGVYFGDCVIADNEINGTEGINVAAAVTALGGVIRDNIIRAIALGINDDSDTFQVVNNRWITDINTGTSTAGWDFNLQLAVGNIQMGVTGLCDTVPYTKIAE